MGEYTAKFTREAKENPRDWLIRCERGVCWLVYIGE